MTYLIGKSEELILEFLHFDVIFIILNEINLLCLPQLSFDICPTLVAL